MDIVCFVCVDKQQPDQTFLRVPHATAFLTVIKGSPDWTGYVVTAKHNLEAAGNQPLYLRFNTETGFEDVETSRDEWFRHDDADVAIIRIQWRSGAHGLKQIAPEQFVGGDYQLQVMEMRNAGIIQVSGVFSGSNIQIQAGNDVSIIGLFAQHYGRSKNLPVARAGTIARMPSEPIEFRRPDGTYNSAPGYLIEFRSWGGTSGSPVLVRRQLFNLVQMQVTALSGDPNTGVPKPETVSFLNPEVEVFGFLGLLSGHFDIEQQARTSEEESEKITTAINSGIAIVTPAQAVHDLLWRADVVEERERWANIVAQSRAHGVDPNPRPRRILRSDETEQ